MIEFSPVGLVLELSLVLCFNYLFPTDAVYCLLNVVVYCTDSSVITSCR